MKLDISPARSQHFSSNWLAWIAVRHFLPVRLSRELADVIVRQMSNDKLSLEELFEDDVIVGSYFSEMWLLQPRETKSSLSEFLQSFIRAISWQNDTEVFRSPNLVIETGKTPVSSLEAAFRLGLADLRWPGDDLQRVRVEDQTSASALHKGIVITKNALDKLGQVSLLSSLAPVLELIEEPLNIVVAKHLGDLLADVDAWTEADSLYGHAEDLAGRVNTAAWSDFVLLISGLLKQSRATAIRATQGSAQSSVYLYKAIDAEPPLSLLRINASHDALIAAFSSPEPRVSRPDLRPSVMFPPLLLESNMPENATSAWLRGERRDAHREFGAVLRRQIALGLATYSRTTKALYGRSIFDELNATIKRSRNPLCFKMAVFHLLESGNIEAVSAVEWSEEVVTAYVDQSCVRAVMAHTDRHAGSKVERQRVSLELFKHWLDLIASSQNDVVEAILGYLLEFARNASVSVFATENVGGRSLEILKDVAERHPELRSKVHSEVANIVVKRLAAPGFWKGRSGAIELAEAYLDIFSSDELNRIVIATIDSLRLIDTNARLWPVVRPALRLLVSDPVKKFASIHDSVASSIINIIVRFGVEQDGEQAGLLFNLHNFNPLLLRDAIIRAKLGEAVSHVRNRAQAINASDVVDNIQALLLVSEVSGPDGIRDALDGLSKLIGSAKDSRPSLALAFGYAPLLLLASRRQRVAEDIGEPIDVFDSRISKIFMDVLKLWQVAKDRPLVFAPLSFPPTTAPNSVSVHNWTYASLEFAESLARQSELHAVLDLAKDQPLLADAIVRAQTIRSLAQDEAKVDVEVVRSEKRETFYAALGQRLALLSGVSSPEAQEICKALLDQCLRFGPREIDIGIFLYAEQLGLATYISKALSADYLKRVRNDENCRLALMPILQLLKVNK